jgi:hypothetical protein
MTESPRISRAFCYALEGLVEVGATNEKTGNILNYLAEQGSVKIFAHICGWAPVLGSDSFRHRIG